MGEGAEDAKLRNAVTNSLKLMDDHRLKTIAFPAISTGIFGYPIERCAKIMISTAKKYLNGETQIRQVVLCLHSEPDYEVFNKELS
jgi:O-acetyl-ADP-ribose deacetylase (regulator of RNase III)